MLTVTLMVTITHLHERYFAHLQFPLEFNNRVELVELEEGGEKVVYITGKISGFEQTDIATLHGFHIHQFGDLSEGCASCGGHFNPYTVDLC